MAWNNVSRHHILYLHFRHLFEAYTNCGRLLANLKVAIPNDLDGLKRVVETVKSNANIDVQAHLPFNFWQSNEDIGSPHSFMIDFCSHAAEVIVMNKFAIQDRHHLRNILKTSANSLQSWRGQLMEKEILSSLSDGTQEFSTRSLEIALPLLGELEVESINTKWGPIPSKVNTIREPIQY